MSTIFALALVGSSSASAQASSPPNPTQPPADKPPASMTLQAKGNFDVKLAPQPLADAQADAAMGRMSIDKSFSGDLQGTAKGEMLVAGTAVKGSAGYVAIERVTGSIAGRRGSFVLQHTGTMNRGAPSLRVSIVPDSGSGELTGISGTLAIDIVDGKHFYTLDYALPAAP